MNRSVQILASFALFFLVAENAAAQASSSPVTVQTDPQSLVPSCRAQNGFNYNGVHIDRRAVGVVGPLPTGQYAGEMACIYYGIGSAPWWSTTACDNYGAEYEVVNLGGTPYCAWPHDGQVLLVPIHAVGDPMPPTEDEFPLPLYWQVNPPASPNTCVDDYNFVQVIGDWRDRTVCEVNLPAISAADCPTATPAQHGRPAVFPADFSNPQATDPAGTQFCVYPPTGAHYGAPDRLWYISGWRAVRIIASEPDFEVTKTLDECESFGANAYRCVYNIRIENHGGPYTGELQIEDVTNQQVNRFFLFDANQTPINCQVFTQAQPQQLTFSAGTVSSARFDLCTLPNVSIDASTPIELTALVQLERSALSPPEAPLNCAAVVLWDGRPDGLQTEDFPSSCEPALPTEIDIEMNKAAVQDQVLQGEQVDFEFEFPILSGQLDAGDQLTVRDQMPRGFRPVDLPRFSNGDEWNCRVTLGPNQTPDRSREITCTSATGLTTIPDLTISAERRGRQTGEFENCADLTVLRSNGDGDIEPGNNTGRCDIVTVLGQPDFAVSKRVESCSAAAGSSPVTCTYSITVSNSGSPYTGSVTIQEFMNVGGVDVSLTDPSGASMVCQDFSNSGQTNQLTTSSGHTINTDGTSLCTAEAVTIDNAPQTFTATVAFDPNIHYGPDPIAINCAGLVMWDDRPSLNSIQQNGGFPGDCVPALPATPCELHVSTWTANTTISTGDVTTGGLQISNQGGTECETIRLLAYLGFSNSASTPTRWMQAPSEVAHLLSEQPDAWRSPAEVVSEMQVNVPGYQYSYPPTPPLTPGAPPAPQNDLIWVHPERRPGGSGVSASGFAFQPFASEVYTTIPTPLMSPDGFIACSIAVVSVSEIAALRQALHNAASNKPASLSASNGNDVWAANINNALAADGIAGASCVGINIQ